MFPFDDVITSVAKTITGYRADWTLKIHPIPGLYGQAMGCLVLAFDKKIVLYNCSTVLKGRSLFLLPVSRTEPMRCGWTGRFNAWISVAAGNFLQVLETEKDYDIHLCLHICKTHPSYNCLAAAFYDTKPRHFCRLLPGNIYDEIGPYTAVGWDVMSPYCMGKILFVIVNF